VVHFRNGLGTLSWGIRDIRRGQPKYFYQVRALMIRMISWDRGMRASTVSWRHDMQLASRPLVSRSSSSARPFLARYKKPPALTSFYNGYKSAWQIVVVRNVISISPVAEYSASPEVAQVSS